MQHIVVCLLSLVLAVPPLTPDQRAQLATATDGSGDIEEAALYPLLHNAEAWAPDDEVGATVPDYGAIARDPADARGKLFLIEGVLASWNSAPRWFARTGSWDGRMQRWVIAVGPKRDRAVIVYLVAPTPAMAPQGLHRLEPVRLVARFYKSWLDTEAGADAKTFLTFIGHDAQVVSPAAPEDSLRWLAPVLALLVAISGAWLLVRFLRPGRGLLGGTLLPPVPPEEETQDGAGGDAADAGPPLPQDPVAALEELQRRRAQRSDDGVKD